MNLTKVVEVELKDGDVLHGYTIPKQVEGYYSFMLRQRGMTKIPSDEIVEVREGKVASIQEYDNPTHLGKSTVKRERERTSTVKGESKASKAFEMLKDVIGEKSSKECIEMLMSELDMTIAGARTYHANIKKKLGLVRSK